MQSFDRSVLREAAVARTIDATTAVDVRDLLAKRWSIPATGSCGVDSGGGGVKKVGRFRNKLGPDEAPGYFSGSWKVKMPSKIAAVFLFIPPRSLHCVELQTCQRPPTEI